MDILEIARHAALPSARLGHKAPRGELRAGYLENKYESPIDTDGLFNQTVRFRSASRIVD
jgi:hypothetical protein